MRLINAKVPEETARIEAVKRISFGEHRVNNGYTDFKVALDGFTTVDLGGDLGVQRRVPTSIEVEARSP
jgi:hypothetical protein